MVSKDKSHIGETVTHETKPVLSRVYLPSPLSQNALNSYCFVLFACVSLLGCLYTFFLLPETKGKTLMEISEEFKAIIVCGKLFKPREVETKL